MPVNSGEELHARNPEGTRGEKRTQGLKDHGALGCRNTTCAGRRGPQDVRVGCLCGRADRIGSAQVEISGHAVIPFSDRLLNIPSKTKIQSQRSGGTPIVLNIKPGETLGVEPCGIHGHVAARRETQQERSECGADTISRARRGAVPRPNVAEIKVALDPDVAIGFLENPVFGAVVKRVVPVQLGEVTGPRVIGIVDIAVRLRRPEITCKTCNPRERRFDQLSPIALRETELRWVEARALVVIWISVAVNGKAQVEGLGVGKKPGVIEAHGSNNALHKTAGGDILEMVVQELVQVGPAHGEEAMVRIIPPLIHAHGKYREGVMARGRRDIVVHSVAFGEAGRIRERNVLENILSNRIEQLRGNLATLHSRNPAIHAAYLFMCGGVGHNRIARRVALKRLAVAVRIHIEGVKKMSVEFLTPDDGERLAEVPLPLERGGHGSNPAAWVYVVRILIRDKEKRFLLSAINLGNPHGPAECASELVEMYRGFGGAREIILEIVGV